MRHRETRPHLDQGVEVHVADAGGAACDTGEELVHPLVLLLGIVPAVVSVVFNSPPQNDG
jgi:hypothetical protein